MNSLKWQMGVPPKADENQHYLCIIPEDDNGPVLMHWYESCDGWYLHYSDVSIAHQSDALAETEVTSTWMYLAIPKWE